MSLKVWLPLVRDVNNQGIKDITVSNNGATLSTGGKLGNCYYFNGSAQYLQFSDTLGDIYVKDFTWAVWLKPTDSTRGVIVSEYSSSGSSNVAFELSASLGVRVYWNGSPDIYPTGCTLTKDVWTHVTIVKITNKIDFYINGEHKYTYIGTLSDRVSTSKIRVGDDYRGGTSVSYMGYMNDLRIYDHALSLKEVQLLARGLVAHYPLNNNGEGGINICPYTSSKEVQYTYPASSYKDQFSQTTTIVPSASKYTLSFYAKSTVNGDQVRAHYYNPNTTTTCESSQGIVKTASDGNIDFTLSTEWERYWVTYTQTETTAVKHIIFPRMFSQSLSSTGGKGTGIVSVKCVKMEEGDYPTAWNDGSSQTTVYDVSGNKYHGTINGSLTYFEDCPRYSLSTKFVDNNSRIRVQFAASGFTNSYTFSWWGKYTNYTSHMMWGFGDGNRLNLYMSSGNFYWNTGDGANNPFNVSAATYGDDQWHHFAVTGDGTTAKLYIDGEFKANAKTYKGITGTVLFFNGWDTSANYKFNGNLSDFRLYATALSQEDILDLYQNSAHLDNKGNLTAYEFIEG